MLVYKIDVMAKLKEKGYTWPRLRKMNAFGQKTMQDMKNGVVVGITSINRLCELLELQPGSIIKWVPDEEASDGKEAADD